MDSFIAPEVQNLRRFAEKASPNEIMMEIHSAIAAIENPNIRIRACRTMSFMDDMPNVLQGVYSQGYFAGYLRASERADGDPTQKEDT